MIYDIQATTAVFIRANFLAQDASDFPNRLQRYEFYCYMPSNFHFFSYLCTRFKTN